jgi:VanZ family protein
VTVAIGVPGQKAGPLIIKLIEQAALPRRRGEVVHAVADFVGVVLGALTYLVWSHRHS